MVRKIWTKAEMRWLKENYQHCTTKEILGHLSCNERQLRSKVYSMKLAVNKPKPVKSDPKISGWIRGNCYKYDIRECARRLDVEVRQIEELYRDMRAEIKESKVTELYNKVFGG